MKNVIFSVILLIFLSNFLIAAPQIEQNYSNFNIKPHFFTKNDKNLKRNSFIDKYDTNNVPWPIAIDNQRLQIDKKEQKTGYFFQKIRPQTYFSVEKTVRALELHYDNLESKHSPSANDRHPTQAWKYIELIYPSMYYGLERQLNNHKKVIKNTHSAVNNIYLNGVRIAAISATGKTQYYLTDQVDSVKVVVDDDGKILNKFEYLPYGKTWITEGEGNNNPKYNSQELDKETSFYFYNARHYDPEVSVSIVNPEISPKPAKLPICRFVTADIVVDGENSASGWNRYAYVGGNPIGYRDPSGHYIKDCHTATMSEDGNQHCSTYQNTEAGRKALNHALNLSQLDGLATIDNSVIGSAAYGISRISGKSDAEAKKSLFKWAAVGEALQGIAGGVGGILNKVNSLNKKSGKVVVEKVSEESSQRAPKVGNEEVRSTDRGNFINKWIKKPYLNNDSKAFVKESLEVGGFKKIPKWVTKKQLKIKWTNNSYNYEVRIKKATNGRKGREYRVQRKKKVSSGQGSGAEYL